MTGGQKKMRYHKWKRKAALAAAAFAAFSGLGFAGCGNAAQTDSSEAADSGENTEDEVMGRYLEEDVTVPEDCEDICSMKFLEDGTLRLCYYDEDFSAVYADSKDQGQTWGEKIDFLDVLGLDKDTYSASYPAAGKNGGIFLTVSNSEEQDEENNDFGTRFYYIDPDGNFQEMTEIGGLANGVYITEAEFTDRNTLIVNITGNGMAEVDLSDGSIRGEYEKGNFVNYFCVSGSRLIAVTDTLHYYDLETGEPLEDASALTEQITSDESNLSLTSTTTYPVVFAEGDDGDSLFFADGDGLYHYAFGGSVVEQVIDGSLNSIGSPDTALVSLERDTEGNFYFAISASMSGKGKILKYVYSADTPATPETELTVYSLRDNSYMRQIAALFQKKYPDIYLNLETGMSEEDAVTSSDALKNLNTEIMAGNGPDVLILDGIPEDTYIEKGMLKDISDLLDKTDQEDGILDNIRSAYQQEDGSQYVMPVRFAIPLLHGNAEDVQSVTDLKTLADAVERHKEEYTGMYMPVPLMNYGSGPFLDALADVNAPAWIKEDGTLDETAVTEFLEQANRIYQAGSASVEEFRKAYEEAGMTFGTISDTERGYLKDISGSTLSVLSGSSTFAAGRLQSPETLGYLYSVEQKGENLSDGLWNGQAQNCFIPVQTVGISAKASQPEAAEKLVEFLFSQEGQKIGTSSGFPVNETVYDSEEYWAVGNSEGSLGVLGSGNADTGEYIELNIYRADDAKTEEIKELGKSLTTASRTNEVILSAVSDAGSRYLDGEISLEDAAREVIRQVNLYLSE